MALRGIERQVFGFAVVAASLIVGCEVKTGPAPKSEAEKKMMNSDASSKPADMADSKPKESATSEKMAEDEKAVGNMAATENASKPKESAAPKKMVETPAAETAATETVTKPKESTTTEKPASDAAATETISAEGSSTVYPICQAFAVEFEKRTNHKVSVGRLGTGGGYKRFVIRQADIWNASRRIDPKEVEELKSKGIEWIELHIAVDGIVVAVNPSNNWCDKLTKAQLKRIWEPESKVKNWSDLDSSWPSQEIVLYSADVDSGTFEYFTEAINDKKKAINTRHTPSSDDHILVQGIAANKFSLGYIPFGYYIESTDKLKCLEVSPPKEGAGTPDTYVEPTEETILNDEYFLSRPLFMYVNKESLKRREVADFLKFAVSKDAQPLIANRGFVRVKEDERVKVQNQLDTVLAELTSK